MNKKALDRLVTYFDEVNTFEFYHELFGDYLSDNEDADEYALHSTIIDYSPDAEERHKKVWASLDAIFEVQGVEHRACAMPPAAYIGTKRKNDNVRLLFAIAIDLDFLTDNGIGNLFSQIDRAEVLPKPTYIVWSGNGIHLYYVFEEPIPCYPENRKKLGRLKTGLTRAVWNRYVTEKWKTPEIESLFQCMRVVGSGTKDGEHVARAFLVGDKVTVDYLDSFLPDEYRVNSVAALKKKRSLADWQRINPKWYENRVIKKKKRRYWTCSRRVYDHWLKRIRTEAVIGHRYFAVFCLAIFAIKSGVPFDELEKDALSLIPHLDELTEDENNHFTEADVMSALRGYSEKYKTFPRHWIEKLTTIVLPPNRRNGNSRSVHLVGARALRDAKRKEAGLPPWNGRRPKEDAVRRWRKANPAGTKAECARETGLDYKTVRKWWLSDFETFEEAATFIDELNPVQKFELKMAIEGDPEMMEMLSRLEMSSR